MELKLQNTSSWTMFIFGISVVIMGIVGIIQPEFLLKVLNFDLVDHSQRAASDYTIVFVISSSMAALNMGIYYMLASLSNWKDFYRWTVPFRTLTFIVFTTVVIMGIAPVEFIGVAAWELLGALVTGIALFNEKER